MNPDDDPIHPAALDPARILAECASTFLRRSGPGGQNRNKVATAVVLDHGPTGLRAEANESRSQHENRVEALFRLRLMLALEIRRAADADRAPSDLWRSRLRGGRININPRHDDFPALLAEALDFSAARGWDLAEAAGALGCSSTQLLKLLQVEPRAVARLNEARRGLGLRPLR